MNSIATVAHVLRHDFRQFRVFLVLYYLIAGLAVVLESAPLSLELGQVLPTFLRMAQILGFVLLVFQVFRSDSPSDTKAQWWARPIGAVHLLGAKLSYVVLFLCGPTLVPSMAGWWENGFSPRQMALGGAELAFCAFGPAFLAAGLAATGASFGLAMVRLALGGRHSGHALGSSMERVAARRALGTAMVAVIRGDAGARLRLADHGWNRLSARGLSTVAALMALACRHGIDRGAPLDAVARVSRAIRGTW